MDRYAARAKRQAQMLNRAGWNPVPAVQQIRLYDNLTIAMSIPYLERWILAHGKATLWNAVHSGRYE